MLGIQLYTVRDKMLDRSSIRDTLVRIKQIGYECVQLASSVEKMEIAANVCGEIQTLSPLRRLALMRSSRFLARRF